MLLCPSVFPYLFGPQHKRGDEASVLFLGHSVMSKESASILNDVDIY